MAYDLLVQKSEVRITANILPSTGQENNGAQHKTDICDLAFCLIFDCFSLFNCCLKSVVL